MIAWTRLKTLVPIAAIGAFVGGTPIVIQQNSIGDLKRENARFVNGICRSDFRPVAGTHCGRTQKPLAKWLKNNSAGAVQST